MTDRPPEQAASRFAQIAALIGEGSAFDVRSLGGGDLSDIWQLDFASGRRVVVKTGPHVATEAAMLDALATTGVAVPPVLAVQGDLLALGYVPRGGKGDKAWSALGRAMRCLHEVKQPPRYGWDEDYAFGTVPIVNDWTLDWRDFWRDCRLRPFLDSLPREVAARVNHLSQTLDRFLPSTPRPTLLHGDLWTGNFIASPAPEGGIGAVLIDPACYIGDASADFAILTLFATPPEAFWRSYGPVPEGYERSINVYRLWPALVHYRLFGATYLGLMQSLLDTLEL